MVINLNGIEWQQVMATGALSRGTKQRITQGKRVQPIVLYRLKQALTALGLEDRAPELFKTALGGAADPDPTRVIDEPDDADSKIAV